MEASALYIVIMAVKYVGQVVAVPALWEKATRATCPLFETIFILMGSALLAPLWIYGGNHGDRCRGCGQRRITTLTISGTDHYRALC